MAWGIIMTGLELSGMLALAMFDDATTWDPAENMSRLQDRSRRDGSAAGSGRVAASSVGRPRSRRPI
jgi:hypothetical protein